nr:hypothetical protein [Tanacetum cinerariifolium]
KNIVEEEDAGVHSIKEPTFEQFMDEVNKLKEGSQWSTSDDNVIDINPKDNEARDTSDSDLRFMLSDDLASLTGFETPDLDDEVSISVTKEYSADNLNTTSDSTVALPYASVGVSSIRPPWLSSKRTGHHIFQEQLPGLLSDALKVTLPQLIKDSIRSLVSKSIADELPQEKNNLETPKDTEAQRTDVQGERLVAKGNTETAMVTHKSEEKKSEGVLSEEDDSDEDDLDKQPLSKRFKIMTPIPNTQNPTPLNTFVPEHLLKPEEQQKEPTPPRDFAKGKKVAIIEEQVNKLVPYQDEGGFISKMPKIKSFITLEGTLSQEEFNNQIKEMKRLSDLKAEKEESEQKLRKLADQLPIRKINYVVNPNKEATMKITRGDNPLNLIAHPNFRLRMLGFSEWLEFHALAFKKTRKSNDMVLQSLRAKFQWVINQSKKLRLPPPPTLATFGMTAEDKKRKRTEFLKEVFVTENITVNGMHRNLIPPLGSC